MKQIILITGIILTLTQNAFGLNLNFNKSDFEQVNVKQDLTQIQFNLAKKSSHNGDDPIVEPYYFPTLNI